MAKKRGIDIEIDKLTNSIENPITIEPDLYVINKKLTKKEIEELKDFINENKRKQALKATKHCKTA